ncbi:MAG: DUF4398 domain-containing protein [Pseudomonadales bacterium]
MTYAKNYLAAALITAAGYAAAPPRPTTSLDAARAAISSAERIDAGRFAAFDLGEARNRLAFADTAVRDEDMMLAERLANEARVGAELAYVRTETVKAEAINDETQRGIAALIEEMRRSGEKR